MVRFCILIAACSLATLQGQSRKPLFTEDFETGAIDAKVWTQRVTGDNTLAVQSDRAAHGKYALLARCPGPSQRTWAFLTAKQIPGELSRHHFGRAYVNPEFRSWVRGITKRIGN